MLGYGILSPVLPNYAHSFGVGYDSIGLLISAFSFTRLVADPFVGRFIDRYGERHRVKAGITGWAQVHGLRGQTSLADRVEWDNYYIENWSLWLDMKIAVMTLGSLLRWRED